jgi:hypothetical protein
VVIVLTLRIGRRRAPTSAGGLLRINESAHESALGRRKARDVCCKLLRPQVIAARCQAAEVFGTLRLAAEASEERGASRRRPLGLLGPDGSLLGNRRRH